MSQVILVFSAHSRKMGRMLAGKVPRSGGIFPGENRNLIGDGSDMHPPGPGGADRRRPPERRGRHKPPVRPGQRSGSRRCPERCGRRSGRSRLVRSSRGADRKGAQWNRAGAATVEAACPPGPERIEGAVRNDAGAVAVEAALFVPAEERVEAPSGTGRGRRGGRRPPYSSQPRSGSIAAAAIGW